MAVRAQLTDLCEKRGIRLVAPPPRLCTDNGVMAAWAGIEKLSLGFSDPYEFDATLSTKKNKDVLARWPLGSFYASQT
eukprot:CAMPEP_0185774524 /NCGR_PEP_ID=MMETSP1174-20130828/78638_1 /TAXON_ID=35687 /ORGANISM="Dictyocha speculum, Strain CCMP1381" /LENGTH=77 /DNA_ID=CAMNT_0028461733 /DNA_START=19 /DNA_END=252 /DNA_ORIENTATION=-